MQVYMVLMVSSKNNNKYSKSYTKRSLYYRQKRKSELVNTDLNSQTTCICLELCNFW